MATHPVCGSRFVIRLTSTFGVGRAAAGTAAALNDSDRDCSMMYYLRVFVFGDCYVTDLELFVTPAMEFCLYLHMSSRLFLPAMKTCPSRSLKLMTPLSKISYQTLLIALQLAR